MEATNANNQQQQPWRRQPKLMSNNDKLRFKKNSNFKRQKTTFLAFKVVEDYKILTNDLQTKLKQNASILNQVRKIARDYQSQVKEYEINEPQLKAKITELEIEKDDVQEKLNQNIKTLNQIKKIARDYRNKIQVYEAREPQLMDKIAHLEAENQKLKNKKFGGGDVQEISNSSIPQTHLCPSFEVAPRKRYIKIEEEGNAKQSRQDASSTSTTTTTSPNNTQLVKNEGLNSSDELLCNEFVFINLNSKN